MSENKVDVAELIVSGRAAWNRFFYPTSADFVPGKGAKLDSSVHLGLADNLRLCLDQLEQARREVGRLKADVRVAYGFDKDAVFANIDNLTALVARLRGAASDVLLLPEAISALNHLDLGISINTPKAAWLRLRQALQGE